MRVVALRLLLCVALLGPGLAARAEERPRLDPRLGPLAAWLASDDEVLRALAAFELGRARVPGAAALAVGVLTEERSDVVLGCALGGLAARDRDDLVAEGGPLLAGLAVRLVAHDHPLIRDRAWQVLRRLAGADPAAGALDLRAWWLGARKALGEEQERLQRARTTPEEPRGAPLAPGETRTEPAPLPADVYDYVTTLRRDGLEVVIVMDHTGSMGGVIGAARARAAALVQRLGWLVPRFRAGLVTYDDAARLRLALTPDAEALEEAFARVTAGGGGDWEEGVDKGIALALRQERLGWSRAAWRAIIVIGAAPPHAGDVTGLIRRIRSAREDVLFDHPVIVSTVSTQPGGVDHFPQIAAAGHGVHVQLSDTRRLLEELVALSFGADHRDRVQPWLDEVRALREAAPTR